MAIYKRDIIDIELENGNIYRSFMHHAIGEGDINGNRFGVRVFRNGEAVSLSGCIVTGYFIRADEQTIICPGETDGNIAYVPLLQSCYTKEGNFTLAIKITGGGVTGTMRIVDGTVVNTTTDAVLDPTGDVPDIDELMAVIERAEDAAEAIADFSVSVTLNSGDDYTLVVSTS